MYENPIVVLLNSKENVVSFLKYVETLAEPHKFVFVSIKSPSETEDDSILTLGDLISMHITIMTPAKHEVLGCLNLTDISDTYFKALSELCRFAARDLFSPSTAVKFINYSALCSIANKYGAEEIFVGEIYKNTCVANNEEIVSAVRTAASNKGFTVLMPYYGNSDIDIDAELGQFLLSYGSEELNSFREDRMIEHCSVEDKAGLNELIAYLTSFFDFCYETYSTKLIELTEKEEKVDE